MLFCKIGYTTVEAAIKLNLVGFAATNVADTNLVKPTSVKNHEKILVSPLRAVVPFLLMVVKAPQLEGTAVTII